MAHQLKTTSLVHWIIQTVNEHYNCQAQCHECKSARTSSNAPIKSNHQMTLQLVASRSVKTVHIIIFSLVFLIIINTLRMGTTSWSMPPILVDRIYNIKFWPIMSYPAQLTINHRIKLIPDVMSFIKLLYFAITWHMTSEKVRCVFTRNSLHICHDGHLYTPDFKKSVTELNFT